MKKISLIIPRVTDSQFLLCRRAVDKHPFPDTWCCAIGGKVEEGESPLDAAHRETHEEAKAKWDIEEVTSFVYNEEDYQGVFTIFTTKNEINHSVLDPDPGEIQFFKSFSLEELKEKIEQDPEQFAPTCRVAIEAFAKNI